MIVYIHGANATSESFTHIRQSIDNFFDEQSILLNYDSDDGFENNLDKMKERLSDIDEIFFIGHSLGGIYSLFLANHFEKSTIGGVTLSTPYGGSVEAEFIRLIFPFNNLMRDVCVTSKIIKQVKQLKCPINWTQVVTMIGKNVWINEPNDGVVTLKSMMARQDFEMIPVDLNHYEVVVSNEVTEIILDKLKKIKS